MGTTGLSFLLWKQKQVQEITGDGRYDLTSGAFNGEAVVTDLSLGNIPADIGASGILNGSVEAAGNYKDGAFFK